MFRKPYTFTRKMGKLVRGVWTITDQIELLIMASVQPITGYELRALEQEGRATIGSVKIYTNEDLNIGERGSNSKGDFFLWHGKKYEVVDKLPYDNNLLNHNKYIAEYRDE